MGHGGKAHPADPSAGWVEDEAVNALAPWLRSKRAEVVATYNSAGTPTALKDYAMELFRQLDRTNSGWVSLRDLLQWAGERCGAAGVKVPTDYLATQFCKAADGSGGLDFNGVLLLQHLGVLRLTFCSKCTNFIDAKVEDGYSCTSCYGKAGRGGVGHQIDLCVHCYDVGMGAAHLAQPAHSGHSFARMSEMRPLESVTCSVCAQSHALVPGYMQGYLGDCHVRPVEGDPNTWVCEMCALRPVGGDGLTYRWESNPCLFAPGGLFTDASLSPAGSGALPTARPAWEKMAASRIAPRCQTCEGMARDGSMPWGVDGVMGDAPPGSYAEQVRSLASAASAATRRVSVVMNGRGAAPLEHAHDNHRQSVCACCHELHDVSVPSTGAPMPGYLYGPGFTDHMKLLANGHYVCEWCAKYMCGRCGTAATDLSNPTIGKWSMFVDCRKGCERSDWGGWLSVRSKLRQLADSPLRPHCSTCGPAAAAGKLLDLSARRDALQEGRVVRTVRCHCCKESHDAAEVSAHMQGSVPAYLPMPDYTEHVKEMGDGTFLCEWCSKWMCHRCARPKWTDTRPEVGLWSERAYFCRGGCEALGPGAMTWDMSVVRGEANSNARPHCRACRERVVTGTLAERPHAHAQPSKAKHARRGVL
ncbi:hypothetical protein FOA52_000375 [Chlamydomonas sp. UWO 241]|nr:hypothetical protein FOA52_000375 [Chlamydomonas sp. UWO 241]